MKEVLSLGSYKTYLLIADLGTKNQSPLFSITDRWTYSRTSTAPGDLRDFASLLRMSKA
jgi:hypothetical protein